MTPRNMNRRTGHSYIPWNTVETVLNPNKNKKCWFVGVVKNTQGKILAQFSIDCSESWCVQSTQCVAVPDLCDWLYRLKSYVPLHTGVYSQHKVWLFQICVTWFTNCRVMCPYTLVCTVNTTCGCSRFVWLGLQTEELCALRHSTYTIPL